MTLDPREIEAKRAKTPVSELERSAGEMAQRERRLRASFDASPAFLAILERDGTVVEINPFALDVLGAHRKDVVARHFWDLPLWDVEVRQRVREAVQACATGAVVPCPTDGSPGALASRGLELTLRPAHGDAGAVSFLAVEGRRDSDLRSQAALQRSFAAIAESSSLFAHEIKNPITAVNVALRAVATELGEDQCAILEELASRMQRVELLARRALSLVKPLEPKLEACSAHSLFQATIARLASEIERTAAVVLVDIGPDEVRFSADAGLLQDALAELVQRCIAAYMQPACVRLTAQRGKDEVLLAVQLDIDSKNAAATRPTLGADEQRSPLGLAIGRRIVEAHGGTLEPAPGWEQGLRFEIRLPVSAHLTQAGHEF